MEDSFKVLMITEGYLDHTGSASTKSYVGLGGQDGPQILLECLAAWIGRRIADGERAGLGPENALDSTGRGDEQIRSQVVAHVVNGQDASDRPGRERIRAELMAAYPAADYWGRVLISRVFTEENSALEG